MPYAIIRDVPASWEHYRWFAKAIGDPAPTELILHVAGPTGEGFRVIEIWESREAWQRCCDDRLASAPTDWLWAPASLRELDAVAVLGRGFRFRSSAPARHDSKERT